MKLIKENLIEVLTINTPEIVAAVKVISSIETINSNNKKISLK